MASLIPVLFGALFTLSTAYALGSLCLRSLPAPRTIVLAVGAAALATLVFLILAAGGANRIVFTAIGLAALAGMLRFRAPRLQDSQKWPLDRTSRLLLAGVLGCYGVLYFFHALAPETQPDAVAYHLGLVAEYHRLGAFPSRVGFYEMVPQGLEMLFLFAFSFGHHSAAKLVHFGFLLATLPLVVSIGRRLQLPDLAGWLAAVLYFCAPVVGVSGTCAYNDAALVFFGLAAFYLLLAWRQERDDRYLLPAGIAAGFCYAIKFSGGIVLPLAVLFVLVGGSRKSRQAVLVAAGGVAMAAPWLLRDALVAGNPVAPLFNRWFPNPYFHAGLDQALARNLAAYGGVSLWSAPWQLAAGEHLQGIFGPLLLALPVGLLTLRRRAGRLCWLAAAALALPWFANHGARFLMPAFPFAALAFAMLLPRPAAWACLAIEAVACWPAVLDFYTPAHLWRLHEVPWRASLRLEPESKYLWENTADYKIARMIEAHTRPGERVFSLLSSPLAYVNREILGYWHSARAENLLDALRTSAGFDDAVLFNVTAAFPQQLLRGVRIRLAAARPGEWDVNEMRLFLGEDRVYSSPQWYVRARPNRWEAPLAFDDNLTTRWRTWESMRTGMYLEVNFDRPQMLTGVSMVSHTPGSRVPFEIDGESIDGKWRPLSRDPRTEARSPEPFRLAAVRALRSAGYRYILAGDYLEGNGALGHDLLERMGDWGIEQADRIANVYLFRVR